MVTVPPSHSPYDGSATPFTIGLKPLDLADWIEIDSRFEAYLSEKERLFATVPDRVFAAEAETLPAQREVLTLLSNHLIAHFPERYSWDGVRISIGATGRRIDPAAIGVAPLRAASLLVQEDLVIMRKGTHGWRLAAASLCFPSSWSLAEKFGRPLDDIHAPVPAFQRGTRAAALIERIFDRMKPEQPVQRLNWSLQADAALHQPHAKSDRDRTIHQSATTLLGPDPMARSFIRVERQTLRKLPSSGDILFTIRIHLDPLAVLRSHSDRARLAASFATQLDGLDADQLAYKGLAKDRDGVMAALLAIAAC